ncbi:MAG TPA: PAS domain S-box protein [Ferruginibacter sp.]|nr:hypothetical protein [Chitinophagaceae bacterium]HRI24874.1 PAS domain S-box protein [Ferruginibacter sp.]
MKRPSKPLSWLPHGQKSHGLKFILTGKEEKYKSLVENSIHAFFLTITDGTILETNNAASVMFGYTAAEFKTLHRSDFIDHNDPELAKALELRKQTGFAMLEATGIRKNGERFPVEITSTIFMDTDGVEKSSTMVSDISERKQAISAMQLSNERYNLVVKATNNLVWDWDLESGDIYRSGNSLAAVYGHSANDSICSIDRWKEYLHPQDKDRINNLLEQYIHSPSETSFHLEYRFRREDGSYAFIQDKGYIIRNRQGKVIRMIGAAEDISERKKTAMAIEESEQRYKMFVQQSTEGIWRIELDKAIHIHTPLDGLIKYCYKNAYIAECNDTFAKMYGFEKASEVIGMPLHKIMPEDNPDNIGYLVRFFNNGFKVENEVSYETDKDGNQVILLNNMVGIVEGDYIKRAWGTQRNITEQKKAEEALAESENRLRTIIQTDPECIKLVNREGMILEMNPAGLAMIEAESAEQVIGKNACQLVLPQYQEEFRKMMQYVFEGNEGKMNFRIRGLKGRELCMETHCVPFRNAAGEISAMLCVTRDITEKVLLENSLNEERKIRHRQLTEAVITGQEKERTQLGEELHDNINQILASTKLYLECTLKGDKPRTDLINESKLLVEKAMSEIRKLSKTLLPPSLGEVGLLQALNELADLIKQTNELSVLIHWNNVNENEVPGKLKLTIFRIIQEQMNNVIKHAEAKHVAISIERQNNLLTVSVKDDGKGFEAELKRNGVGLRNIGSRAEVNNGVVNIYSKPGAGCELVVQFPC